MELQNLYLHIYYLYITHADICNLPLTAHNNNCCLCFVHRLIMIIIQQSTAATKYTWKCNWDQCTQEGGVARTRIHKTKIGFVHRANFSFENTGLGAHVTHILHGGSCRGILWGCHLGVHFGAHFRAQFGAHVRGTIQEHKL